MGMIDHVCSFRINGCVCSSSSSRALALSQAVWVSMGRNGAANPRRPPRPPDSLAPVTSDPEAVWQGRVRCDTASAIDPPPTPR
ncbi:hypothetical protein MHYP_G00040470 [Metynnis hypsauchen]